MSRILVIKHGALGDVVLATAPFKAIREHHKGDHITLLTTQPYAEILQKSGWFDEIWIDQRPKLTNPFAFFGIVEKIRRGGFARIYDLQTSERTGWYHYLLSAPKPEWVGTAKGASHRHDTPERTSLHTVERQKQQLAVAGITELPKPDVSWLASDVSKFALPERYALIIPGGSSHRPGKRWPATHYGALCNWLAQQKITPVLIGTKAEASVLSVIESVCAEAVNLSGKTSFEDVVTLARGAVCAVGNDTGPIHLVAAAGCPTLVLFSQFSSPVLCAPRGADVTILTEDSLANLMPDDVVENLKRFVRRS